MTEPAAWEPANPIEQAMLDAVIEDDRQSFFQLIVAAELYLPQVTTGGPASGQQFATVQLFDQTFLPVYTSVGGLAQQFAGVVDGFTTTNYAELARKWPDPQWRLAVNPGLPIDAYLSIGAIAGIALGDSEVETLPEVVDAVVEDEMIDQQLRALHARADYPGDPAAALTAAAGAGDAYGYLEQLLESVVLIPVNRPVDAESIVEPGFPWRPAYAEGASVVEVFTTPEAFARIHPTTVPTVEVALPFALAFWPEGYGLSVDPGGVEAVVFDAGQVGLLLPLSTPE